MMGDLCDGGSPKDHEIVSETSKQLETPARFRAQEVMSHRCLIKYYLSLQHSLPDHHPPPPRPADLEVQKRTTHAPKKREV